MIPSEVYIGGLQVHLTRGYGLDRDGWEVGTPEPREAIVPLARRHGVANDSAFLGATVAALRFGIIAESPAQLQQRIDSLRERMRPGRGILLEWRPYPGAPLRRMMMKLGGRIETQPNNGLITFLATTLVSSASPLAFSSELIELTYDPTEGFFGFGVEWPLDFPQMILVGAADDPFMSVENLGNMPTAPLWVVHGPVANAKIVNLDTGDEIVTTVNLSVGETAWIDVERRELKLLAEDGTLRLDLIDEGLTTWWMLEPGSTRIRLEGTGLSGGDSALTVRYRHAWLPA